jgi:hypothetical protein
MAADMMVRPGDWNEWAGVWFQVLDDPLTARDHYRVTVHPDPLLVWVAEANGGVRMQLFPPDTLDFARTDGAPL